MIEVTCGTCGSMSRHAEADVPPGGKTVTCAKCKARIHVPHPRVSGAMPAIPAPNAGGGTGDVINLSDLPAPKRPSPLAGAKPIGPPPLGAKAPPLTPPLSKSMPKANLPPLPAKPTAMGITQQPKTPAGGPPAIDMDAVDLPAPVGPTPRGDGGLDLPAPKRASGPAGRDDISLDLPAPKRASGP